MNNNRPDKISELVGQTKIKKVIQIQTDSAKKREDIFPHVIFDGASGSGKTTFAESIANELGYKIHKCNGATFKKPEDMIAYFQNIYTGDVLFIDEAHSLPKKVCEFLYTVLEDFEFQGVGRNRGIQMVMDKFTCIAATTHIGRLPKPFRDRFKHIYKFEPYQLDELCEIVKRVFNQHNLSLKQEAIEKIAKTCRGNPRNVIQRAEFVRDYILTNEEPYNIIEIIALSGYNKDGFTQDDINYIRTVGKGEISLNNLSSMLNIPKETIANEIEPYLINVGLIKIGSMGRYMDFKKAKEYFGV